MASKVEMIENLIKESRKTDPSIQLTICVEIDKNKFKYNYKLLGEESGYKFDIDSAFHSLFQKLIAADKFHSVKKSFVSTQTPSLNSTQQITPNFSPEVNMKLVDKRKKFNTKGNKKKIAFIEKTARRLQRTPPKSEVWFREHLIKANIDHRFLYNERVYKYIPDVVNFKYKVIVEVDGDVHDNSKVKAKDIVRERDLANLGFTVLRVKAYDDQQATQVVETLISIINSTK